MSQGRGQGRESGWDLAEAWIEHARHALDALSAAYPGWMTWAAGASLGLAVGAAALVPWLLANAPADYLLEAPTRPAQRPPMGLLRWLGRHLVALLLLLAGVAMLVLPGQGLLTILVALSMMDIPGKRKALRRVLRRTGWIVAINRVRARRGRPPLKLDPTA